MGQQKIEGLDEFPLWLDNAASWKMHKSLYNSISIESRRQLKKKHQKILRLKKTSRSFAITSQNLFALKEKKRIRKFKQSRSIYRDKTVVQVSRLFASSIVPKVIVWETEGKIMEL